MMNYLKMLILLKLMNLLTDCNAKINKIESKTPSITSLATNAALNAKINEVKGEIPSISDIATTAVLTTVENKISNQLVIYSKKKIDYDTKYQKLKVNISSHLIVINL